MSSVRVSDDGGSRGIYDLLSGKRIQQGSKEDKIGFQNAEAIEVWENKATGQCSTRRRDLDDHSVTNWLQTPYNDSPADPEQLCSKILIGDQVFSNDRLHPPEEAGAVQFSRCMLENEFKLPTKAVDRVAATSKWQMDFSQNANGPSGVCEGLGTATHSFVMSKPPESSCLFVFVVWHRGGQCEAREEMVEYLERISDRRLDAALFAYIASSVVASTKVHAIDRIQRNIGETDLHLIRFATQRTADSLFGSAHTSANRLDGIEQDLRSTLKLVGSHFRALKTKSRRGRSTSLSPDAIQRLELKDAFAYRKEELQTMLQRVAYARNETARQLTTALNMMVFAQQELTRQDQQTSIEIAEASKAIAEETKKDGSSMKTLAVVTMCFLPATTVSSVFSMSMFDWQAKNGEVVSARIWVYFVLAIPLTLLILGVWWIWQRQLLRPQIAGEDSKA